MTTIDYDRWADIVDRETAGEELADEEQAFAREFEGSDALARVEAELFSQLSREAVLEDGPSDGLARNAVSVVASRRVVARRRVMGAGFVFAAAAGAALWFSQGEKPATVAAVPSSTMELVEGQVTVGGRAAANGASVAMGQEVSVATGVACLAVEAKIHLCAGTGSKFRVTSIGGAAKEVELLQGSVATALDPLPPGQQYSIVASGVRSTAVGTAFTVEKLADGVKTVVHEGKVRVGGAGNVITSHKIGLSTASGVTESDLTEHEATETPEWRALGRIAGRSVEDTATIAQRTIETPEPTAEAAPAPVARTAAAQPKEKTAAAAPAPTSADLLARARQALRNQSWQEAATAYRELVDAYPGSAEARAALVPLAGLELDRLGQPAVALGHLDSYLASGGALSMEARLTRIRAFRALGRASDEAKAIDEFLAEHPSSLEAERLRQRREALSQ